MGTWNPSARSLVGLAALTSLTLCSSGWSQSRFTSQWLSRKVRVVPRATSAPRIRDRTRPASGQTAKWAFPSLPLPASPWRRHAAFPTHPRHNTHTRNTNSPYKAPREMLQGTHSIISSKNKIFKAKEKQYKNENKTDIALQQEKG